MTRALILVALVVTLAPGCPATPPGPRERPPARRVRPEPRPAPFAGQLRQALRQNLGQYRRRLRRCHELAMAQDFRVGGRLEVVLTVAPAGTVTDVKTRANESGSPLLARCVAHVARGFVFPSSDATHPVPLKLRFRRPRAKYTVRLDDVPPVKVIGRKVTAKRLLTPKNVSGDRLALSVVRLEAGATLALPGLTGVLGVYVLQGAVRGGGVGRRPVIWNAGHSVTVAGRGRALSLHNPGARHAAALLFFAPPAWEAHYLAGASKPTGSPISRRTVIPGPSRPTSAAVTISGRWTPTPVALTVRPGRRAVINPGATPRHHALLVTSGALWVTLQGVRLPAEAGMAIYVPGGAKATATPALRRDATFVIMPWTGQGTWTRALRHELVRFEPAPLPKPMPRPRRTTPFRLPGVP